VLELLGLVPALLNKACDEFIFHGFCSESL
jgi:hypothetical protein